MFKWSDDPFKFRINLGHPVEIFAPDLQDPLDGPAFQCSVPVVYSAARACERVQTGKSTKRQKKNQFVFLWNISHDR